MNLPTSELTPASQQAVAEAALVLQHTQGFVYLPILVPSERAGALVLEQLRPALKAELFQVPWPLPPAHTDDLAPTDQRITTDLQTLVDALDNASRRLPAGTLLLLDASSGTRQAVAQRLPVWLNQRREDWRRNRQGLLLLWPQSERDALLQGAPDLWSMRAAAPWVEEQVLTSATPLLVAESKFDGSNTTAVALSPTQQRQWQALQNAARWADADLSAADVLALIEALRNANEPARALALAERVLNAPELGQQTDAWRASFFHILAIVRGQQGDPAGALVPAQEAVAIFRRLAQDNSSAYNPDLASGLNNWASYLGQTGHRLLALELMCEAADILGQLVQDDPRAYEPDLAACLNNLASLLSQTGESASALPLAKEAVAIRRRLAEVDRRAYESDLAMSLNNLANCLSEVGDRVGALAAVREAVDIRRRQALTIPFTYDPYLAGSLNNLANSLSEVGDYRGAVGPAQEAVTIYRHLVQVKPAVYESDLAMSLKNLASRLSEIGDHVSALGVAKEAVGTYRRLVQANPVLYEANLAGGLWILMRCQNAVAHRAGALKHGREALQLFAKLAQSEPARFEPLRQAVAAELQQLSQ